MVVVVVAPRGWLAGGWLRAALFWSSSSHRWAGWAVVIVALLCWLVAGWLAGGWLRLFNSFNYVFFNSFYFQLLLFLKKRIMGLYPGYAEGVAGGAARVQLGAEGSSETGGWGYRSSPEKGRAKRKSGCFAKLL